MLNFFFLFFLWTKDKIYKLITRIILFEIDSKKWYWFYHNKHVQQNKIKWKEFNFKWLELNFFFNLPLWLWHAWIEAKNDISFNKNINHSWICFRSFSKRGDADQHMSYDWQKYTMHHAFERHRCAQESSTVTNKIWSQNMYSVFNNKDS